MPNKRISEEGEVYYIWESQRLKRNRNVISVTTGATGSGKSLFDLRRAEISYRKRFNEDYPIDNVCFSVRELMRRIQSGELRKGEIIILEEAGVNVGSADWQNSVVKMFNYLLQSFRSMNICIYLNLPMFSMLSKQARQLSHIHTTTMFIDYITKECVVKIKALQWNQSTGKCYAKLLKYQKGKGIAKIKSMRFKLPSDELRELYEKKKQKFLDNMTEKFSTELDKDEVAPNNKIYNAKVRRQLVGDNLEMDCKILADILKVEVNTVQKIKKEIKDELKSTNNEIFSKEYRKNGGKRPIPTPLT